MLKKIIAAFASTFTLLTFTGTAWSGDYIVEQRIDIIDDRDVAAAAALGLMFGVIAGAAIASERNRTVIYYDAPRPRRYYEPRVRYQFGNGGGYAGNRCGAGALRHNNNYQGRIVYRNGCYYPD